MTKNPVLKGAGSLVAVLIVTALMQMASNSRPGFWTSAFVAATCFEDGCQ